MKKNIQKIPKDIYVKLETIKSNEIAVGCAVKLKKEDIIAGKFSHLGITMTPEELVLPASVLPPDDRGKYSDRNINGLEIVRKDLPKETHYNSIESPNWGDSYNGTHTVNLPYQKYPRDFQSPRELEIAMTCKDTRPDLATYIVVFQVQEVLDRTTKGFENKLFENLNLLQENIDTFGIEAGDMPIADYAKSLHVSWEILPPGTIDETIERIFRGKNPTSQQKDVTIERYNFFLSLSPKNLVFGQSGFRRYFGALLEDNLVVFENIEYGNAVYILFDNWEELSKLSRLDLMSGKFGKSFERVIHTGDWKTVVKDIVGKRRKGK